MVQENTHPSSPGFDVQAHIEALADATTESQVASICQSLSDYLKADFFSYGVVIPSSFNDPKFKTINNFPELWCKEYSQNAYLLIDPIIAHCTHKTSPVFFPHNNLSHSHYFTEESKNMMRSAQAVGLATSVTIPIHDHRGCTGFFGIYLKDNDENAKKHVQAIAPSIAYFTHFVHEKMIEIEDIATSREATSLTEREKECLRWTADGKTCWEVASILKISERTVNFHLHNAMNKLNTVSKPHAVAIAIAQGYIRPQL